MKFHRSRILFIECLYKVIGRYIKINEIVSDIGGLILFITLFSFLFTQYYADIRIKIILLNKLYKSKDNNKNQNLSRINSRIIFNNYFKNQIDENELRACKSDSLSKKAKFFIKVRNRIGKRR
jgi:hypothetical protein